MPSLPLNLTLQATQTQWASAINPILANPLVSGQLLTIGLSNGVTTFNHGLSRNMQGWIIVDQNESASIYRSEPFNSKTLTLTSSAAVTVTLWVF